MSTGIDARRAAMALVYEVFADGEMIGAEHSALEPLSGPERARALTLARTTLRHLPNIDRVLRKEMRRAPELEVMTILGVATAELLVLGGAAHGVVNAAVSVAKEQRVGSGMVALVNAVLHRVAEDGALPAEPPRLPKWLRGRLQNAYGNPAVVAMERVFAEGSPVDLTVKSGAQVEGEALPTGSVRIPSGTQVSAIPGFEDGAFWVQDAAAALPVKALGDIDGLRILDLCAAPGGKTMQLAAVGGQVTALDSSTHRMERLRGNLRRTKLSAEIVVADALEWQPEEPLDVVVLDAPCSATGTIRRHPDLPHIRDASALKELVPLQKALLDRATEWVKPGGRLLYITCSLLPEEGEAQAAACSLETLPIDPIALGGEPHWATPEGYLRLRPDFWADRGGMDGFFAALFRKPK